MGLYKGFDLHSSNSYVGVIDEDGRRMWKKKLRNDPSLILATLRPFKEDIEGVGETLKRGFSIEKFWSFLNNYLSW